MAPPKEKKDKKKSTANDRAASDAGKNLTHACGGQYNTSETNTVISTMIAGGGTDGTVVSGIGGTSGSSGDRTGRNSGSGGGGTSVDVQCGAGDTSRAGGDSVTQNRQILEIFLQDPDKPAAVAVGGGGSCASEAGSTIGSVAVAGSPLGAVVARKKASSPSGGRMGGAIARKKGRYDSPVPAKIPESVNTGNYGIHVTVLACRGLTEFLFLITGKDGKAGYCMALIKFLMDIANAHIRAQMKIHEIFKRRHPNDPTRELLDPPKRPGAYEPPYWLMMVHVNNPAKNTPENRALAANGLCTLNNSRALQADGYGNNPGKPNNNNMMAFAGDITPSDSNNLPYLSDFLMVGDVMTVIGELFCTPEGERLSDAAVTQNEEIMNHYFSPDLHALVRSLYAGQEGDRGLAPGFNLPNLDLD